MNHSVVYLRSRYQSGGRGDVAARPRTGVASRAVGGLLKLCGCDSEHKGSSNLLLYVMWPHRSISERVRDVELAKKTLEEALDQAQR